MASGTQGYEAASRKDVIEQLIERFKNRKKNDGGSGGGGGGASPSPNEPASVSVTTPTQKLLVEGTTVNQLMSGSSAITTTTGGDITKYDGDSQILQVQVREQQKTNQLLEAQNQLLLRGSTDGGISKFDEQESMLEGTEDLSDTQGYEKAKSKSIFARLFGFLGRILDFIKPLVPAIVKAAAGIVTAIVTGAALKRLTRLLRPSKVSTPRRMINVTPKPEIKGSLSSAKTSNLLPSSTVKSNTNLLPPATNNVLKPSTAQAFDAGKNVKSTNRILEKVEVNPANFQGSPRRLEKLTNMAEKGTGPERIVARNKLTSMGAEVNVRPVTEALPNRNVSKGISNATDAVGDAGKLSKVGKFKGLKYAIPGLSAITSVLSLASGNYADAIIDAGDAAADIAIVSGNATAASIGGAVSNFLAPIGAMIGASWLGEASRGWGDWISGDGTNVIKNSLGALVNSLSAALEVIGAPIKSLIEFVKSGFNMEKSNKIMAETDSNIREGFRKSLNAIDFLNIIPDEKGSFGTLSLYGDDAVNAANAKMRGDGEVKNARGGSYFLDNPSNFGPFQGGEAGGEVVTFTPFGGRKLVNEMGAHMTDALQAPFQFAIGGIAAAIDKVIGMLGPIGQFMSSAIGPKLKDLVKASGLTNITLSSMSGQGGLGPMGGVFQSIGNFLGLNRRANAQTGPVRPGTSIMRNNYAFGHNLPPTGTGEYADAQQYGADRGGRRHAGQDFDISGPNDAFESQLGGEVIFAGNAGGDLNGDTGYGNVVEVYNKDLNVTERIAEGKNIHVKKGDMIRPGTVVMSGESLNADGKPRTGVIHYEIRKGRANASSSFEGTMDPIEFLKEHTGHINGVPKNKPGATSNSNLNPTTTLGSRFMPNINSPQLDPSAQAMLTVFPQLAEMIKANNKPNANMSVPRSNQSLGGFQQPAIDLHTNPYAPLNLMRLGVN